MGRDLDLGADTQPESGDLHRGVVAAMLRTLIKAQLNVRKLVLFFTISVQSWITKSNLTLRTCFRVSHPWLLSSIESPLTQGICRGQKENFVSHRRSKRPRSRRGEPNESVGYRARWRSSIAINLRNRNDNRKTCKMRRGS